MNLTEKKEKAEKLVLGSIAYFGVDTNPKELSELLKECSSDLFQSEKRKKMFNFMKKRLDNGEHINPHLVLSQFDDVEDYILLSEIQTDKLISPHHLSSYINILKGIYREYELHCIVDTINSKQDIQTKVEAIKYGVEKADMYVNKRKDKSLMDIFTQCKEVVHKYPSGYKRIDEILGGGFEKKRLYTVAARTGCGKTTMLMNLGYNFAMKDMKVKFLSLEMPDIHVARNLVRRMTFGKVTTDQDRRLDMAMKDSEYKKIHDNFSLSEYGNTVDSLKMECEGYDVVCIDQLSFMRTHKKTETRALEVSSIVHELKEYCVKNDKIVLLAVQINRAGDSITGQKPQLVHLKESGGIEEASDVCMLIHKEEDGTLGLNIAKNRCGAVSSLYLHAEWHAQLITECKGYEPLAPNQLPDTSYYDISKDKDFK